MFVANRGISCSASPSGRTEALSQHAGVTASFYIAVYNTGIANFAGPSVKAEGPRNMPGISCSSHGRRWRANMVNTQDL